MRIDFLLAPHVLLSVFLWCAFVAASVAYIRQSTRIGQMINDQYPELWELLISLRSVPRPPFGPGQSARQLAALILIGFPRQIRDRYPGLLSPIGKCRDAAIGMIILFAASMLSMTLWPQH
jgi:hypothetical protein